MKKPSTSQIRNRRAKYDFSLIDKVRAGLVLTGPETKSIRYGRADLRGSYVTIKNYEAWLINSYIAPYQDSGGNDYDPNRTRKLLLSKVEIHKLITALQQKLVIVPLAIESRGRYIKLQIATARSRKKHDKRAQKIQLEQQRTIRRHIG